LDELINEGQPASVPAVMRELVGRRLAEMSKEGRATMEIAAVLGNTFDQATLLAVAAPIDPLTLQSHLDEAIDDHIVRATPNGYAFEHALLREGVYWNLSRPRRMLLHRRAGEVLEQLALDCIAERAAELAYHFNMAGQAPATQLKAFEYTRMAERQADVLSSLREAEIRPTASRS
jgi:predicted ATPase